MLRKKREHPKEKAKLHPRNRHRERYDFELLVASCPELAPFVRINEYNDQSVDFFDPDAVKMLNKALLVHFYDINSWDIPQGYLCPPIPGRADYIHHIADLLANCNGGEVPSGSKLVCLDVGVGANCIYPIIGRKEYGWAFIGADVDPVSVASAKGIVSQNPCLEGWVDIRLQPNASSFFRGIIRADERVDLTICNPPFHASMADAQAGSIRKLRNLGKKGGAKPTLNFGGQSNELWCDGGEERFVRSMISQSRQYASSCLWFSTLVSKESNLPSVYHALRKVEAVEVTTIPMGQGNKITRIVAWTFLSREQQQSWAAERW
ncbi:23S rRNA (adenine(1618)-N(6))-methyltransferase RlmF [uncultured Acetobacteroides sp.]|uniref:23S rRNA (adenine(1618)-N(6))-methyltransferase RlmF n=1 Tax=uncultured Acetobacteroides sp. TaxID=1760811 RepID=UPI0029F4F73D|nr:23S rRNA (adenine(1618)-N(6))-methyltransferase RlmF [uncultured Acetobacteroides sp.]